MCYPPFPQGGRSDACCHTVVLLLCSAMHPSRCTDKIMALAVPPGLPCTAQLPAGLASLGTHSGSAEAALPCRLRCVPPLCALPVCAAPPTRVTIGPPRGLPPAPTCMPPTLKTPDGDSGGLWCRAERPPTGAYPWQAFWQSSSTSSSSDLAQLRVHMSMCQVWEGPLQGPTCMAQLGPPCWPPQAQLVH